MDTPKEDSIRKQVYDVLINMALDDVVYFTKEEYDVKVTTLINYVNLIIKKYIKGMKITKQAFRFSAGGKLKVTRVK